MSTTKHDATLTTLKDKRQVRVIITTEKPDRVGDIVVQSGLDTTGFNNTKSVLWNHDQNSPIAFCVSLTKTSAGISALVQFPEEGVSAKSDECYKLILAGVVNSASIGFIPLESEPIDRSRPGRGGSRITKSTLLEFSFVSVPANTGAVITERSALPTRKPFKTPDRAKSGRMISGSNADKLRSAHDHLTQAQGIVRDMLDSGSYDVADGDDVAAVTSTKRQRLKEIQKLAIEGVGFEPSRVARVRQCIGIMGKTHPGSEQSKRARDLLYLTVSEQRF